jgi:hypothetical protein
MSCPSLAVFELDTIWDSEDRLEVWSTYSALEERWTRFVTQTARQEVRSQGVADFGSAIDDWLQIPHRNSRTLADIALETAEAGEFPILEPQNGSSNVQLGCLSDDNQHGSFQNDSFEFLEAPGTFPLRDLGFGANDTFDFIDLFETDGADELGFVRDGIRDFLQPSTTTSPDGPGILYEETCESVPLSGMTSTYQVDHPVMVHTTGSTWLLQPSGIAVVGIDPVHTGSSDGAACPS